jgi:hypothetical protein
MRSALAYRKQLSLRALGFENSVLHTRLEAVFALYFCFLGAFFAALPQKTGLSAPIPQPPAGSCGISTSIPCAKEAIFK